MTALFAIRFVGLAANFVVAKPVLDRIVKAVCLVAFAFAARECFGIVQATVERGRPEGLYLWCYFVAALGALIALGCRLIR